MVNLPNDEELLQNSKRIRSRFLPNMMKPNINFTVRSFIPLIFLICFIL